jgi:hypothetical protein
MTASGALRVAPQPRKQLLLTLLVGIPRPGSRPWPVREAVQSQRIRRIPRHRQVRHLETEVLELDEPTNIHLVQMSVCLHPRDRSRE